MGNLKEDGRVEDGDINYQLYMPESLNVPLEFLASYHTVAGI